VSNADPRHVFPGYSKRLRALDAEGKRTINVMKSYENAVRRRIGYLELIADNKAKVKVFEASAKQLPAAVKGVKLVVINPPYISSIRYLETMKIEMGWLGFIGSQRDYLELDKKVTGTERYYKKDLGDINDTGLPGLDKIIAELIAASQPKMAKVVSEYFRDMQAGFRELARVLMPGGHIVIKISDSKVRGHDIATHQYFIDILEALGLKTLAAFKDDFDPNSRSLLTARNSYSGMMTFDWVLIFKK
jgi:methylase of polypeptide subunit release factors